MTSEVDSVARPLRGVVVTAHPAATDAGREALLAGGNAVDAAVAAAWALCVCEPSASGLGGQTVLLLHYRSRTVAIDGHSRAPSAASVSTTTRAGQRLGHRATTVPTTPAALAHVHDRYGVLSAARVMRPALRLAESGYEITRLQSRQLRWCRTLLMANGAASRFLGRGHGYRVGDLHLQPELAACLRRLAAYGVDDFYRGEIAQAIDRDMRRHGGLLRAADLAAVRPPAEIQPIAVQYRGQLVQTMQTPSGGPQLAHALEKLSQRPGEQWQQEPDAWYEDVAWAVHSAFRRRAKEHRRGRKSQLQGELALHGVAGERQGETTHLCTADADGNLVTLTQSIQSLFGAKVANPEYGFLYNNYLRTCPRREHAHRLAAGQWARSNAAPTFVVDAAQSAPILALGAAGSRRIISSLVQVISAVLDLGLSIPEAVARPRVHPRLREGVWLEAPVASPALVKALASRYGRVEVRKAPSYSMGAVQALETGDDGQMHIAADPRRDGAGVRC
jgi:gamma-glutamyltranspeptidase/glutathione hydrolase